MNNNTAYSKSQLSNGYLEEGRYPYNGSSKANRWAWMADGRYWQYCAHSFDGDCLPKLLFDDDDVSDSEESDDDYNDDDFAKNESND